MGLSFREFLNEENTVGYHNDSPGGAFLGSDYTNSEAMPKTDGNALHLPSTDLVVPSTTKSSRIKIVERNKNPILIQLDDGTRMYFTYDEFKRIKGSEPTVGKTMRVVFQRNPNDNTQTLSKIQGIEVY